MWYAIVEGDVGETLYPEGLLVIDTFTDLPLAERGARMLSATLGKPHRVIGLSEISVFKSQMSIIQGAGSNPMTPQERADIWRGIKKAILEIREREQREKEGKS